MEREIDVLAVCQQFRKILEKRCEKLSEDYGVRLVEMDILHFLSRTGNHGTAKDIMSDLHISKAHISKSVENLRRRGYLIVTEDANDHRCVHLTVSEKADALIRAFSAEKREFMSVLLDGVTAEERAVVIRAVKKMIANLDQEYQTC